MAIRPHVCLLVAVFGATSTLEAHAARVSLSSLSNRINTLETTDRPGQGRTFIHSVLLDLETATLIIQGENLDTAAGEAPEVRPQRDPLRAVLRTCS